MENVLWRGLNPPGMAYTLAMDLSAILRSQAKRYSCGVCGHNMADCGIHILAQQGNRALVRVTCTSCTDENLLQIIFQTEDDGMASTFPKLHPEMDQVRDDRGPISGDEMLEVHRALAGLTTGLTDLFTPPSDDSTGA